MKKLKLVLWLIVLGLIAVIVYQNREFLMASQKIEVDLWVQEYGAELTMGVILLGLFLGGLLISYFLSLAYRFKTRKAIRKLNEELNAERKKVSELEARLDRQSIPASSSESQSAAETSVSPKQGSQG